MKTLNDYIDISTAYTKEKPSRVEVNHSEQVDIGISMAARLSENASKPKPELAAQVPIVPIAN